MGGKMTSAVTGRPAWALRGGGVIVVVATGLVGGCTELVDPPATDGGPDSLADLLCVPCNERCVDPATFQTDRLNCGECGLACLDGQSCVAGACLCDAMRCL